MRNRHDNGKKQEKGPLASKMAVRANERKDGRGQNYRKSDKGMTDGAGDFGCTKGRLFTHKAPNWDWVDPTGRPWVAGGVRGSDNWGWVGKRSKGLRFSDDTTE